MSVTTQTVCDYCGNTSGSKGTVDWFKIWVEAVSPLLREGVVVCVSLTELPEESHFDICSSKCVSKMVVRLLTDKSNAMNEWVSERTNRDKLEEELR
jgi:hypothetical protein